jgi:menaquinone-dependent protoporphyrinogen oxidase
LSRVLIVYATHQGHTLRVAQRVAEAVGAADHAPTVARVEEAPDVAGFDAAVIGAPVHMGHFSPAVVTYAKSQAPYLGRMPSGFFSISLTAAQGGGASREAMDRYLRTFQRATDWHPDVIASFAGALPYTRFSLLHRALMRHVAAKGGLDTDDRHDHVYTDWDAVGGFVEAFLHHVERANGASDVSSTRPTSA